MSDTKKAAKPATALRQRMAEFINDITGTPIFIVLHDISGVQEMPKRFGETEAVTEVNVAGVVYRVRMSAADVLKAIG